MCVDLDWILIKLLQFKLNYRFNNFPTNVVPPARCPDNTFTCDDGECITKMNSDCDFISDCADGSDEARCGE